MENATQGNTERALGICGTYSPRTYRNPMEPTYPMEPPYPMRPMLPMGTLGFCH